MAFWFRFKNIFSVIASVQDCPPLVQICLNTWNTWNTLLGQRHYLKCIGPTYIWYIANTNKVVKYYNWSKTFYTVFIFTIWHFCAQCPTLVNLPYAHCPPVILVHQKKTGGCKFYVLFLFLCLNSIKYIQISELILSKDFN